MMYNTWFSINGSTWIRPNIYLSCWGIIIRCTDHVCFLVASPELIQAPINDPPCPLWVSVYNCFCFLFYKKNVKFCYITIIYYMHIYIWRRVLICAMSCLLWFTIRSRPILFCNTRCSFFRPAFPISIFGKKNVKSEVLIRETFSIVLDRFHPYTLEYNWWIKQMWYFGLGHYNKIIVITVWLH